MNKENSNKIVDITNNLLITDDPLNILANVYYKPKIEESKIEQKEIKGRDDDYYMSFLIKRKKGCSIITKKLDIFNELQIFSKYEKHFKIKKYFKFPFNYGIENDGSFLYHQIHSELIKALSNAYTNYRQFKEPFKVKTEDGIIEFGKNVRASMSFKNLFSKNDITVKVEDRFLIIDNTDISLVYDVIINMDIPKGCSMPFIISDYEFENSIGYHTRIEEGPIIRVGNDKEYSYFIFGPLYSGDYIIDDNLDVIFK